jgi:hypothetical protein
MLTTYLAEFLQFVTVAAVDKAAVKKTHLSAAVKRTPLEERVE